METGQGLDEMARALIVKGTGGVQQWREGGKVSHVHGAASRLRWFTQLAGGKEWMWDTVFNPLCWRIRFAHGREL